MAWTKETAARLPEPYRDFMLALKPVVDSKEPGAVLRITGIPFGRVYGVVAEKHRYDPDQVRELAGNLSRAGLISEDQLGFFTPTGPGEGLIAALTGAYDSAKGTVPPLPELSE